MYQGKFDKKTKQTSVDVHELVSQRNAANAKPAGTGRTAQSAAAAKNAAPAKKTAPVKTEAAVKASSKKSAAKKQPAVEADHRDAAGVRRHVPRADVFLLKRFVAFGFHQGIQRSGILLKQIVRQQKEEGDFFAFVQREGKRDAARFSRR